MGKGKGASIVEFFGSLEDPRIERCKRHQLLDRILLAVKENQGRLDDDVRDRCEGAEEEGFAGAPHGYGTTL